MTDYDLDVVNPVFELDGSSGDLELNSSQIIFDLIVQPSDLTLNSTSPIFDLIAGSQQFELITESPVFELQTSGVPGPTGPQGPSGGAVSFAFGSATTWTVNHNLNRHVGVEILDSSGRAVLADVQEVSPNQVIVSFLSPISGVALIS